MCEIFKSTYFGMFIGTLARWYVKMRNWHAFGKLARGQVDHAGTYGTRDKRFSKLDW